MESNPMFQCSIDENSQVPLYYQLILNIKRCITGGLLKPGEILPSEAEICDVYQVSRSTVRQAFGELEAEGIVIRKRGKGTFISLPKLRRKLDSLYSFSNDMLAQGIKPESKMIFRKAEAFSRFS